MSAKLENRGLHTHPSAKSVPSEGKLIGYARISTVDQDPRMQIDALLAAGVDPGSIYQENISGAARKRPQFEAMLKDARDGDIVVVWKLDRIGRNARQVLNVIARLEEKGAKIRCLTQGIDTSTAAGRMLVTILSAVAEMERDLGRERTIAGLRAARERGNVGGRAAAWSHEEILEFAKLGTKPGARKAKMSVPGFIKAKVRAALAMEAKNAKRKPKT